MSEILMLEAIALSVIGACGQIIRDKMYRSWDSLDNLALAVIVGIVCFAMFGEPSTSNVVFYMAGGYGASEFLEWIFKPWWEAS